MACPDDEFVTRAALRYIRDLALEALRQAEARRVAQSRRRHAWLGRELEVAGKQFYTEWSPMEEGENENGAGWFKGSCDG